MSQPFGALGPYARCTAVRAARREGSSCVTTLAAHYSRRQVVAIAAPATAIASAARTFHQPCTASAAHAVRA